MTATTADQRVPPVPTVTPVDANRRGPGVILVDVREPDEYAAGHAKGAQNIPLAGLDPTTLRTARMVFCLCRSGKRSAVATAALLAAGVDARNVTGGIVAWVGDGLPIQAADGTPGTVL